MKKTLIILFGAPGCGKGFLGECIKKELLATKKADAESISYISVGDLLRAEIAAKTPLGNEIETIVSSGGLVSDDIVKALVQKALDGEETIKFLDGFPRTEVQLSALKEILAGSGYRVISFKRDTPVSLILKRVKNRRVCKNCGATHTIADGKCTKCGGESVIRKDDAVIERRLDEYVANTAHLWNNLALVSNYMLVIDGAEEASDVAKTIVENYFK